MDKKIKRFKRAVGLGLSDLSGNTVKYVECLPGVEYGQRSQRYKPINTQEQLSRLTKTYLEWLHDRRTLLFEHKGKKLCLTAAKRGNYPYYRRTTGHIDLIKMKIPDIKFFEEDYKMRCARSTPLIFITLTVDAKQYSRGEAWDLISDEFNRFTARLRKVYGAGVTTMRGNESHYSGYPHIHALIFLPSNLPVVRHHGRGEGIKSWRITDTHRKNIKACWTMGHSDILACYDTGGVDYIAKYITKGLLVENDTPKKELYSLAIQWSRGKRSFSLSKYFIESLGGMVEGGGRLDRSLRNSNQNKYFFLGSFPRCYEKCIIQRGEIPLACAHLRGIG